MDIDERLAINANLTLLDNDSKIPEQEGLEILVVLTSAEHVAMHIKLPSEDRGDLSPGKKIVFEASV